MGAKGELKLLACQKGEQWNAVNNEDPIATDEVASQKDGALVLADVTGSGSDRKVQRIQDGARQIVTLLQSYSRQQEKSKSQEEEIQQWMESLTFQSQELNRREMELESRREQLEQIEREIQQLEHRRTEIEQAQAAADRLRSEIDHKNQEIQQAWDQLRQQQEQLQQERQGLQQERSSLQESSSIDAAQAQLLQNLLQQATGSIVAADFLKTSAETCLQIVTAQETILQSAPHEAGGDRHSLREAWEHWQTQANELASLRAELQSKQATIAVKQEQLANLNQQIEAQASLVTLLEQLASGTADTNNKVDTAALEAMPIEQLQDITVRLQKDFEKLSSLVSDQEEELKLQHQTIDDLKEKINRSGEFDRIEIEKTMEDERENYNMLNETLVGQRRNLHERQEIYRLHQRVLDQRQGIPPSGDQGVDLTPALDSARAQYEALVQLQQATSESLAALENAVRDMEGAIAQQGSQVDQERETLMNRERELAESDASGSAIIDPMIEQVTGLKEHLEALIGNLDQAGHTVRAQEEALGQIQTIVTTLAQ